MGERAQTLAKRFEQANLELIQAVTAADDKHWKTVVPGEGRTVGVVAHHIASYYPAHVTHVEALASGSAELPTTWEWIHNRNAEDAVTQANITRDEVLALLRTDGSRVTAVISQLSDEQLDHRALVAYISERPFRLEKFIEWVVIGHTNTHLADIKAATS
ncbi:MAG: hypothetical protein NVS4B8_29130 [Herpetosiphon sp.]